MPRIVRWLPALAAGVLLLATPGPATGQVYQLAELSEAPTLRSPRDAQAAVLRTYPRALRDAGIGGKVQVRFVVRADGTVDPSSIEVLAASQEVFAQAAVEALREIRFVPGRRDGQPVASVVIMPVVYSVS